MLGIVCFSFGLLTTICFVLFDYQSISIEKTTKVLLVLSIVLLISFSLKYLRKKLEY